MADMADEGGRMTETTGLYPALLAVKAEVRTLPKDATNPHYRSKYTPLDTIVEQVEPILTKHGLVWITKPIRDEHGDPALFYRLVHAATKEFEEGSMALLLTKADPQGQGSAITYARRYALCSVLNLVADDDDDGEAASGGQAQTSKPAAKPKPKMTPAEYLHTLVKRNIKDTRQLDVMLAELGRGDVKVEEGWAAKLDGSDVSILIDRLKSGEFPPPPEPVPTPPSDVPEPGADEFSHPQEGMTLEELALKDQT